MVLYPVYIFTISFHLPWVVAGLLPLIVHGSITRAFKTLGLRPSFLQIGRQAFNWISRMSGMVFFFMPFFRNTSNRGQSLSLYTTHHHRLAAFNQLFKLEIFAWPDLDKRLGLMHAIDVVIFLRRRGNFVRIFTLDSKINQQ